MLVALRTRGITKLLRFNAKVSERLNQFGSLWLGLKLKGMLRYMDKSKG